MLGAGAAGPQLLTWEASMSTTPRGDQDQLALAGDASATGVRSRRRLVGGVFSSVGLPLLGVLVAIGGWFAATEFFEIQPFFLPSPQLVGEWLRDNPEWLVEHGWVTVYETLAGFATGGVAGLVAAVLLVASRTVERALLPLIVAFNAIPKVALLPLFLVWFDIEGHEPKIALAASICFFPVMIATMAGLTSTPAELGELARSLSASRWKAFVKVRVPWALPQVFVGLKLGMTLALIGAVVAEMQRPTGGLGTLIALAGQNARTTTIFATILVLMAISLILFYAVVLAERLLLPWARETAAARL
jgi:NitT/TauT family transport system permease protein